MTYTKKKKICTIQLMLQLQTISDQKTIETKKINIKKM